MEHHKADECPMCGSLMGTEGRPAAMRSRAETLDQLDRLERRLRDTEAGTWRLAAVETVCGPCRETLVGLDFERSDALVAPLRARIKAFRASVADAMRRSA